MMLKDLFDIDYYGTLILRYTIAQPLLSALNNKSTIKLKFVSPYAYSESFETQNVCFSWITVKLLMCMQPQKISNQANA